MILIIKLFYIHLKKFQKKIYLNLLILMIIIYLNLIYIILEPFPIFFIIYILKLKK